VHVGRAWHRIVCEETRKWLLLSLDAMKPFLNRVSASQTVEGELLRSPGSGPSVAHGT